MLYSTILLSALKNADRIQNRRYAYIELNNYGFDEVNETEMDMIYQSNDGGAVVVYLDIDVPDSGDVMSGELAVIKIISKCMKLYRHKVLTILCLPKEATRVKSFFFEEMENVSMIEFVEKNVSNELARAYLMQLAKENAINADKRLLSTVEEDEEYTYCELRNHFDEWYDYKLKNFAFPQYKDMKANSVKRKLEENKGSAYDRLQKMIGLTEAKKVINQALAYHRFQQLYKENGIITNRPSMHMVFTGNPGIAKTSVARLVAGIFCQEGILSKGHLVEVGRSDLVGAYVGWTAKAVKKKFKQACGGVLFIDEAYSLVDEHKGSFGDEAINTIVQEMENHRDDVIVIFAGYKTEMEQFLETNPGLRSRIAFHVPFADYDADELTEIAKLMAKEQKMHLSENAIVRIHEIAGNASQVASFGNGRYVRNLMERANMTHANRIMNMGELKKGKKLLTTLEAEDFEEIPMKHDERKSIGFVG